MMPTEEMSLSHAPAAVRTYADIIVDYLIHLRVEYVFGIPGGAIEPFYDALARRGRVDPKTPKMVVARHESGAVFMACGYARETGRLGVCCSTTGPGATNLITGVASAYSERTPLLVITPQTALSNFGRRAFQDSSGDGVDIVNMFVSCTRYSTLVSHPEQLERKLFSAVMRTYQRPRGPVHLSIPMDIMGQPLTTEGAPYSLRDLVDRPPDVNMGDIDALCSLLRAGRRIVLFVGGGCRGGTMEQVFKFAELMGAPVVASPTGKMWANAHHPLFRGIFGFAGHQSARNALLDPEVDFVLAAGTSLDEFSTSGWDQVALLNKKLIHVDATLENFSRSPMARLHVYGDVAAVFATLTERLRPRAAAMIPASPRRKRMVMDSPWPAQVVLENPASCLADDAPLKPQRLMGELVSRFPVDTRFVVDVGNSWAWTIHYLHPRKGGTFRISTNFGAMTWGIGVAVGTAFGCPGIPVVCITGDGAMLMGGQELTVAVEKRLPVIFVVLNDQALGMVKHGQRLNGAEPIGHQLPKVDFAAVARAMGAAGHTVRVWDDLARLDIAEMCRARGPVVLDVYIDPEEVPPMGVRMRALDRRQRQRMKGQGRRTGDRPETVLTLSEVEP